MGNNGNGNNGNNNNSNGNGNPGHGENSQNGFTPITVDKTPYKPTEPISGKGLYDFLKIGSQYDLYLEVHGPGDDTVVPRTDAIFDFKPGDHFYTAQASLNPGGC